MATQRSLVMLLPMMLLPMMALASCTEKQAVSNLDIPRFGGLWHAIREKDIDWSGIDSIKCRHSLLHPHDDGSIGTRNIVYNITSGQYQSIRGVLRRASPEGTDGRLQGHFGPSNSSIDYTVLGTDYDNYAVVSICLSIHEGNIEMSAVMSRQRTLEAAKLTEANALLPEGNYLDSNQDSCPEPDHHHGHEHGHDHSGHEGHEGHEGHGHH